MAKPNMHPNETLRKTLPLFVLLVVILLQAAMMLYYTKQKKGYHPDEMSSYSQANGHLSGKQAYHEDGFYSQWHGPEYFSGFLTVQPGETFDYAAVLTALRQNVHPPLYHLLLHTLSSFYPDTFTKRPAAIINILSLLSAVVMLYFSARLLLKSAWLAILPAAVWGLSAGTMSISAFHRMYGMLSFFFIAIVFFGLLLISGKSKAGLKFCISLGTILFLGLLTHQYTVVILGIAILPLFFWLLYRKEYAQLRNCVLTVVSAMALYCICWPVGIQSLFQSKRGKQAVDIFKANGFGERMEDFYQLMNRNLFNGALTVLGIILLTMLTGAVIAAINKIGPKAFFKRFLSPEGFSLLFILFCGVLFFLIVEETARLVHIRYICAVYPVIVLAFFVLFRHAFRHNYSKSMPVLLFLLALFTVSYGFKDRKVDFVYTSLPNTKAMARTSEEPACIAVMSKENDPENRRLLYEFMIYDQTYVCETPESLDGAMKGVAQGQPLFFYVRSDLDQDAILEQAKETLQFKEAEKVSKIYTFFFIYQIEWA